MPLTVTMRSLSTGFVILILYNVGIDCAIIRGKNPNINENPLIGVFSPAATPAQHQGHQQPRIVGGEPVTKNEYPWLVAIFLNSNSFKCGGSLVSSRTVLTAAHCLEAYPSNDQITVHAGEHDVSRDGGEEKIGVASYTLHHSYNTHTLENDFAIIQLDREVVYSATIKPSAFQAQPLITILV